MDHGKTTEEIDSSVAELVNLMNDTFTCCMRNYQALLPYLEKKNTRPKIYQKLVHVNIMLNKLNEELVGLRVEYVTVSSHELGSEAVVSERGRKRKTSDESMVGRPETKSIKTEVPLSSSTKYSSENFVSKETEETRHTQVQKTDTHRMESIKTEVQDCSEVEDLPVFPISNSENPTSQASLDTRDNRVTVCFDGDEESASVADRFVRINTYFKPIDTITQTKNNEMCLPLQNSKSETRDQEKYEDIGKLLSKDHDTHRGLEREVGCATSFSYQAERPFNNKEPPVPFTACDKESDMLMERRANSCNEVEKRAHSPIRYEKDCVPVQRSVELFSPGHELYGVIRYENRKLKCVLCDRELANYKVVYEHVNGKRHQRKQAPKKNSCAKKPDVSNNSSVSTTPASVCATVPCSLADSVAIVDKSYQLEVMEHTVRLNDMWKYFSAPLQINRKYFLINSGEVICSLCNQRVEERVRSVKIHIIKCSHLKRIKRLRSLETAWKSSNQQMLKVAGILDGCIPKTQFTLQNDGIFCRVCQCFCENHTVLNHLTSQMHYRKSHKME
ncbi:uncharacterized protein LOC124783031 [Schistocerca piceifrons]|uniref:uncharacterized protein LOC124783031 n=1 Tax=Schistocerca piceifrons TaxID=274613 RepID=UPI001F5EE0DE|nr:uncharacterized protein LOC124783031 [Schistocerca piceifrons]XP_047109948.1 uncharacterized protein LOC124783031 [Schistocerca piceifrons]XP_047109949.1 uncharacterized protein LOC124783031 [Schistocerca piceifrons]